MTDFPYTAAELREAAEKRDPGRMAVMLNSISHALPRPTEAQAEIARLRCALLELCDCWISDVTRSIQINGKTIKVLAAAQAKAAAQASLEPIGERCSICHAYVDVCKRYGCADSGTPNAQG